MSDGLLDIHAELSKVQFLSPETLDASTADTVRDRLDKLAEEARAVGEEAKAEMLSLIAVNFLSLHTIGVVDDQEKFASEASHAIQKLEVAMLALDGATEKNRGKALRAIKESRPNY